MCKPNPSHIIQTKLLNLKRILSDALIFFLFVQTIVHIKLAWIKFPNK